MLRVISQVKDHFSHVRPTAWHYKLIHRWVGTKVKGKACTYYWVKLPLCLLLTGLLCVAIVIMWSIAWFSGHTPGGFSDITYFHPYKLTRNGKNVRFAPWEILSLVALPFALYFFGWSNQTAGVITVAVLGGLITLGFILIFLVRNEATRGIRSGLKSAWDRVCPNLTIVEVSEKKGSES